jgi:hypothetical protein
MKLAILAALVAISAAQFYTPTGTSLIFKPGVEYIYHYKGHVLSGIPSVSKQFSGILIDTLVIFQFQQDYKVVMRLEKIKLFKLNEKITTKPLEPLNESELTLLTGEVSTILTEYLTKPIKFRYVEGEVRELEKETEDKYWSVNIKKGILSLFQVTLKEKSTTSDPTFYDPTMSFLKTSTVNNVPFWKNPRKSNSIYKVMETDVTGTCETKYSVISDRTSSSPSSVSTMHVTAIRDFDSCVTEPFHIKGLFQGVYSYDEEDDLLHPMVHTDYIITGDRTHFLIKEVTLRGKYSFMPHGLEGGDMSTFILQKLTLKTTEPIRTPIRLSTPKPCTLGLMMVIPDSLPERRTYEEVPSSSWLPNRRESSIRSTMYEMEETEFVSGTETEILTTVDHELKEVIECMYTSITEKSCAEHIYRVDRLIRRIPKDKLKPYITRIITSGSQSELSEVEYRKSEILLDLLPTLSSTDSALVLIELIREQHVSPLRGSLMIKGLSLTVKPTPVVIRALLDLFKEIPKEPTSRLGSKTILRQSLLLSVGTVTHRMINVMRSHGKPQPEILNFLENISGEMKRMLEEATTEHEKILVLKTIGNMGAMQTIPILTSYMQDTRLPLRVRTSAVFAFRRLVKQFNKAVIPILMGVYMDTKEERELRQASFLVIMSSVPGFSTLEMIVHKLRHEPSSQIRSLVYTSLVNLATHTVHQPELKELKENARLILKNVRPIPVGMHDSVSVMLSKFSETLDMGVALKMLKIKSKDSGLPEALVGKLHGMLLGKHRRLLEVGVEGKALEVLIRKIFGPHGLLKDILKGKISLEDFVKPLTKPGMGGVEYKIKEILQKMMVELRPEERPFGAWYIHVLSNEIGYMLFNTENVEDLINRVSNKLPELIIKLTRGIKVDIIKSISHITSLSIASPIGLPISLNYSVSGVLKVNGLIKVSNLPTWSSIMSRETLPEVTVEVDLKPHVDVFSTLALGVNMRWLTTAIGLKKELKSHVPVKVLTHLNPTKHVVSVKYFVPKENFIPLVVNLLPGTIIKYYPTTVHRLPYILDAKEIINSEIIKTIPIEHTYRCGITGLTFEVVGKIRKCGPTWCPTVPLYGGQMITIKAHPSSSVEFVHLKIVSLKSNWAWEGVPSSFNTETTFSEMEREEVESVYLRGRSVPEITSTIGDFEPITPDSIFTSEPIKRQILVTLGPNTLHSPKVKGLFTWLMGRSYLKHQFNAQIIRSSYEGFPSVKLLVNTVINPTVLYTDTTRLTSWWNSDVSSWKSLFHRDTFTSFYPTEVRSEEFLVKKLIKWEFMGERQEIKVKIYPGSPIDFSRELSEHNILTSITLPEARAQKYKLTLEAEFTHMGKKTLKFITLTHDVLRYIWFSHVTTGIPTNPPTNKVIVAVEILPWWEQMNVIVKTPLRNSYITKIPFYLNPLFPTKEKLNLHEIPSMSWYSDNTTEEEMMYGMTELPEMHSFYKSTPYKETPFVAGECTIDTTSLTVNTYDDASSVIPIKKFLTRGCEVVLTQDCTNYGLFSIVGKDLTSGSWKIKHLIPNYEIEVIKTRSGTGLVTINGQERRIHSSEPLIIRDETVSGLDSSSKVIKIEKIEGGTGYLLKFFELGVTVITELETGIIKIKLSPVSPLQGQLCGLCGNFNLDQSDEFKVPEYMKVPSTRSWYHTSIIPSETCDIDRISTSETDDYTDECIKEEYITRSRGNDISPLTCVSERKVKVCKSRCRPVNTERVKVCFRCEGTDSSTSLPRSTYTPYWESDSSVICSDFSFHVEEPTTCVPITWG